MEFTKKTSAYIKGKGLRKASYAPDSILRLKGFADARKDSSISTSYISKLIYSTDALINKEILKAEEILYPVREEAASIITSIDVFKEDLIELPSNVSSNNSALAARTNKKVQTKKDSIVSSIRNHYSALSAINEFIISVSTALEQRIDKTKTICMRKIRSYEAGLRSGGMSDYKTEVAFNDASFEKYIAKHVILDEKIKRIVNLSEEGSI